jgi:hypothetical protein
MNGKQRIMKWFPDDKKSFARRKHERRAYVRYTVSKIVSFAHRGKELLTVTMDLTMGGMKIKTHYTLPKNEHLKFKMILGSEAPRGKPRGISSAA